MLISITYAHEADRRRAETRAALEQLSATAEEVAHQLSEAAAALPVAQEPGDAADQLFLAADSLTQPFFQMADLFERSARRVA